MDRSSFGACDEREGLLVAVGELPTSADGPRGNQAQNRNAQGRLDLPRVLDVGVEVLEEEGQGHAAEQTHDGPEEQVQRLLRPGRPARNLRPVHDVDVGGEEGGRDLRLAEPGEQGAVEVAVRVDFTAKEVVLRHVVGEPPRQHPLLGEVAFQLPLVPDGRRVVGLEPLDGPADLDAELAAALGGLLRDLPHARVAGLEDLAELLVLALLVHDVLLELGDERALEHRRERVDILAAGLSDEAFLGDAVAAGFEPGVGEAHELLRDQVLGLACLVSGSDEEDVIGLEEPVEIVLGRPELLTGVVELLGQELGGVARGLDLLVELLGDEGLGQRVGRPRGEVRVMAVERDLHEPRVPHGLHRQTLEKELRQRGRELQIFGRLRLRRWRHGDPPHEPLAQPALGTRPPALLALLEVRVLVEVEEPDDPVRQRAALEELVLGLVEVLLRISLDDVVELHDPRLVFLDPERDDA